MFIYGVVRGFRTIFVYRRDVHLSKGMLLKPISFLLNQEKTKQKDFLLGKPFFGYKIDFR